MVFKLKVWSSLGVILVFFSNLTLNGQFFSGEISYRLTTTDTPQDLKEKSILVMGQDWWNNAIKPTSRTYYVSKNKLIRKTYDYKGKIKSITYQDPKMAEVRLIDTRIIWSYEEDPAMKYDNLILKKRTKEMKKIKGFSCRKYIFERPESSTIIEAWITDEIPYNKWSQVDRYFAEIITSYGVVLEKTIRWGKAGTQLFQATLIKRHEIDESFFTDPFIE